MTNEELKAHKAFAVDLFMVSEAHKLGYLNSKEVVEEQNKLLKKLDEALKKAKENQE